MASQQATQCTVTPPKPVARLMGSHPHSILPQQQHRCNPAAPHQAQNSTHSNQCQLSGSSIQNNSCLTSLDSLPAARSLPKRDRPLTHRPWQRSITAACHAAAQSWHPHCGMAWADELSLSDSAFRPSMLHLRGQDWGHICIRWLQSAQRQD